MRTQLVLLLLVLVLTLEAQRPTLEMSAGAGNPTGNGPTTANQTVVWQRNVNNPSGNTIGSYSPNISVTYSLTNQQFTSIEGNPGVAGTQFGAAISTGSGGVNAPVPSGALFPLIADVSGSLRAHYTACGLCGEGTGIDSIFNRGISMTNFSDALISSTGVQNFPTNARVRFSDLVITFSQPVTNPVINLTGMGAVLAYSTGNVTNYTMGFATEFDLLTPGLTLTKLSGSTFFNITGNSISNSASRFGSATLGAPSGGILRHAASGSVRVNGNNIKTVTLRTYLKGDGGIVTNNSGVVVPAANGNIIRWGFHSNFIPGGTGSVIEGLSGDIVLVSVSISAPITVSGNVFNDVNAGNVNNSTGVTNVVPSGMFANLINAEGNVAFSVPVNTDGTYTFASVLEGTYTVNLSKVLGVQCSPAPATGIPTGWVSTGEFNGTPNTGNDGTINANAAPFAIGLTNITNINFGIQQPPTANIATIASQVNPGGTAPSTNLQNSFGGTDPSNGSITAIKITSFPTNATSITINNVTYTTVSAINTAYPNGIPTSANGNSILPITVDPINGVVTVAIPYKVIDNGGLESVTNGVLNVPFTIISLMGNVFNDIGGLVTNTNVDGVGIGNPSGAQLYANLLNAAGSQVIASVPVNTNGTYTFASIDPSTNYVMQLSTNQGTVGAATPATVLPSNWVHTGEDCCDNTGNDGSVNGLQNLTVGIGNIISANFGIEQLPNSGVNVQPTQPNPSGSNFVTVPATAFSGTDPDGGTITAIEITTFPTDVTSIRIGGITYNTVASINSFYPNGIPTNASGQPIPLVEIDPANGANRVAVIPYVTIDNARKKDLTAGSVTLPFDNASVVSGNVFNDLGGLVTNTNVNGAGIGLPSGVPLYAYLINGTNNVVRRVPVNSDGTYAFVSVPDATYSIKISTTLVNVADPAPAVVLPTNWDLTGEDCCDNLGSDGAVNGIIASVIVAGVDVPNNNFGIEQLPNSGVLLLPAQINPGSNVDVLVAPTSFSATDPDGGTPTRIKFTSFPSNATSITIAGITYTTILTLNAAYPNGLATNALGQPTAPIYIDPIDGNVSVVISYAAVDEANREDPTPGSLTIPFFTVSLSGNVFNDLNGLTDMVVNGSGIGVPSGTQLYANLLDATGAIVIGSVLVNSGGDYVFSNIPGNTSYNVQISTLPGTPTQATPATTLPTNWVNTGDHIGAMAGNDGMEDGLLQVSVLAANINNVNFGIEQLPNTGFNVQPTQPNPPGAVNVTVPSFAFSGTDADMGIVTGIRITTFPTNATSITIAGTTFTSTDFPNNGVVVPSNTNGAPTQSIEIDPIDGTIDVLITYTSIDNAGKEDLTPGNVTLPFSAISISGNVFDDGNGITNTGNIDGTPIGSVRGAALHANLLNAAGTIVIATVPINPDGTYQFYGLLPNTTYTVQLSANPGLPGQPTPIVGLPAQWVNIGENIGLIGNDGLVNSLATVPVTTTSINNVNFGIDERPLGTDIVGRPRVNPGGIVQVSVPPLAGADSEDGTMGAGSSVRIDVLPTNGLLFYDADGPGGNAPTPITMAGTVISNYNPSYLTIDPGDATTNFVSTNFQYSFIDAAGVADAIPNMVTMDFYPPVVLRGTVYQDIDGSANGTHVMIQNGTETGTNLRDKLYAYIIDQLVGSPTFGQIIGKTLVAQNGDYAFGNLISTANTVRVIITTNATGVLGSSTIPPMVLQPNWVNTSPLDTIVSYPANPPGLLVDLIDFGIEERPLVFNSREPDQINPGGMVNHPVPANAFFGEDIDIGGTVDSIRISIFPPNLESITININGMPTTFTSATWPVGGVTIPTDDNGRPDNPVLINPIDGVVDIDITYYGIDNAGRPSLDPAVVTVPFTQTLPANILAFNVEKISGNAVKLNWSVSTQPDVSYYEVQFSSTASNFVAKGMVSATISNNYSFIDNNPLKGSNYYRLKIVDRNGAFYYSEIKVVKLEHITKPEIYPNPTSRNLKISLPEIYKDKRVSLTVYDTNGKLMQTKSLFHSNAVIDFDLNRLATGMYIIKIATNNEQVSIPILKQ